MSEYLNHPIWKEVLGQYTRGLMQRHGITTRQMIQRLDTNYGIQQTEMNFNNKISRGNFSGQLLLAVLSLLPQEEISLDEVRKLYLKVNEGKADGSQDQGNS